jgi:hypothetical protein
MIISISVTILKRDQQQPWVAANRNSVVVEVKEATVTADSNNFKISL